MSDGDIDYSDIPPLGKSFFNKARVVWPPPKKQLSIRLDIDVLEWLKGYGRGYQTRINHILRAAMEGEAPRRQRPATHRSFKQFLLGKRPSLKGPDLQHDKSPMRNVTL